MVMSTDHNKDIAAIFRDGVLIDRAIEAAAREAILRHKQLGQPVPVWRDGKTVFVSPEELEAEWQDASLNK
jgi:hypothetical protein